VKFISFLIPETTFDIAAAFILFIGLGLFLLLTEILHKKFKWSENVLRKTIHILTGMIIVAVAMFIDHPFPIIIIAIFFAVFNYFSIKTKFVKGLSSRKHSLGTVYYPVAVILLIYFSWEEHRPLFFIAVTLLALADALAAIAGERVKNPHKFCIWKDQKSIEGSLVMFLSSNVIIFIYLYIFMEKGLIPETALPLAVIAIAVSIYLTIAETISANGSDNINITLISAIVLKVFIYEDLELQQNFLLANAYAFLAGFISYKFKFLNFSGAVTAYFIAVIILGFGGWAWVIPMLAFFILSSILTKSGKKHKEELEQVFEKGSIRDAQQVLANGGLATLWVVVYYITDSNIIYLLYLASLAAATADTWATEIGAYSKNGVRLITDFKPVKKGRSGGVSIIGTLGALAGSCVIAFCGLFFISDYITGIGSTVIIIIITLSGFLGSVVDSVLGATVQVQYRCRLCQKITEKKIHCEEISEQIKGNVKINNDVVNFAATLSAAFVAYLFFKAFIV